MAGHIPKPLVVSGLSDHPLSDGIVGAFPMGEQFTGFGYTVFDASGYGNDGVITGPMFTDIGHYGYNLNMGATVGNRVTLPSDVEYIDYSKSWTISFQMRLDSYHTSFPNIFQLKSSNNIYLKSLQIFATLSASYTPITIGMKNGFAMRPTGWSINLGQMYNITLVYIGGSITSVSSYAFFVDGVSYPLVVGSAVSNFGNVNDIGTFTGSSHSFDGTMENLVIWDRALTHNEQSLLYHDPYVIYDRPVDINEWIGFITSPPTHAAQLAQGSKTSIKIGISI